MEYDLAKLKKAMEIEVKSKDLLKFKTLDR